MIVQDYVQTIQTPRINPFLTNTSVEGGSLSKKHLFHQNIHHKKSKTINNSKTTNNSKTINNCKNNKKSKTIKTSKLINKHKKIIRHSKNKNYRKL